jgi:hypothetical protein
LITAQEVTGLNPVKVTNLNKKITQYPINKGVAFFYAL